MKSGSIFILFLLLHTAVLAQAPHSGKVQLKNGESISGTVDINSFINSAVVTSADGRQLTYHASMIESIKTVDECDFAREYRCFDYRSNSFFDRMEKKLFQVVTDGEVVLLRRIFEYDVFDATDDYTIEEFYYVDDNNKVKRIRNFKRQILPMMDTYATEVETFRKRNHIHNMNREDNMYLMVSYFNRLSSMEGDALTLK